MIASYYDRLLDEEGAVDVCDPSLIDSLISEVHFRGFSICPKTAGEYLTSEGNDLERAFFVFMEENAGREEASIYY